MQRNGTQVQSVYVVTLSEKALSSKKKKKNHNDMQNQVERQTQIKRLTQEQKVHFQDEA